MRTRLIPLADAVNRAIRLHAVFGDDLAVELPDGDLLWYRSLGPFGASQQAPERLVLHYSAGGVADPLLLDFGALKPGVVEKLLALGNSASLAASERRWAPTLSRAGSLVLLKQAPSDLTATIPLQDGLFACARRRKHPSHMLDRLVALDRALAAQQMEALFADGRWPGDLDQSARKGGEQSRAAL